MQDLNKREMLGIGFMIFSIFFGAGNLIFPPLMAQNAGSNFIPATIGFLITSIGLPLLGLIVISLQGGKYNDFIAQRVHPRFVTIAMGLLYLSIGPLFAVPRTSAVSFEIGIKPFLAIDDLWLGQIVYSAFFFIRTYFFAVNPNKVIDYVGKILSPALLVFLCVLFARTFYEPIGHVLEPREEYELAPFFNGFTNGYLTMDLLASVAIGAMVSKAIMKKGITDTRSVGRVCIKASVLAVVLMCFVYISLAYLGATSPSVLGYFSNGGMILSAATYYFFGDGGKLILAAIIGFACLTTSIGMCCTFSEYFEEATDGLLKYKVLLRFAVIFSFITSNAGLTELIRITLPFLVALYPIFIVLVLLSLFDKQLGGQKAPFCCGLLVTFPFSILDGIKAAGYESAGIDAFLTANLPLYSAGMGWLIPAVIAVAAGCIYGKLKYHNNSAA